MLLLCAWINLTSVRSSQLLTEVASQGFIIIAAESCPFELCFSSFYADQLAAIEAARQHPGMHPALAAIDWAPGVGLFGHSMGAMSSIRGSERQYAAEYNITAAAPMHTCKDSGMHPALVDVPIFFTTGSADLLCLEYFTKVVRGGRCVVLACVIG